MSNRFCSQCGQLDDSNSAKALYHRCGAEHLRVHNEKLQGILGRIAALAANDKLPHNERVSEILSMTGFKVEEKK